jgi:hypothetical protein
MSMMPLLLAAASANPAGNGDAGMLSCDLAVPGGSHFQLEGQFDEQGFQSNLTKLTGIEGSFSHGDIVMSSGGPTIYHWSRQFEADPKNPLDNGQKLDLYLTKYGSQSAVMSAVKTSRGGNGGRHDFESLIGVGLCDVRMAKASEGGS